MITDYIVPELLDRDQLAALLSVSPSHISAMQSKGILLEGINLGSCKRWRRREVLSWVLHGCPSKDEWAKIIE